MTTTAETGRALHGQPQMPNPMHIALLVPGDPDTLTGGYLYAQRLVAALREAGHVIDRHALSHRFPFPDEAALEHADRTLAALPDGTTAVVDGLAFGAMPQVAGRHASRLALVALVHHPLAAEAGLDPSVAHQLDSSERAALEWARRIVVTSASTARMVGSMGVPIERIAVVEPGTDPVTATPAPAPAPAPAPRGARSASRGGCVRLLCVATLTPRKGHADLFEALARIDTTAWRLDCVGSTTRDPATAAALRAQVRASGLVDRIALHGEVDAGRLAALYRAADAFVLPSRMEGYGMAFAEALAHGLPVIACRAGAVPDTVPPDAALMVSPGDVEGLAGALQRVMSDAKLRVALAASARRAGLRLPDWPSRARAFVDAIAHLPTRAGSRCAE